MDIHFTEYLQYRAKIHSFDLTTLEEILRYSPERYHDTETKRSIIVGKHRNTLVLIPYRKREFRDNSSDCSRDNPSTN